MSIGSLQLHFYSNTIFGKIFIQELPSVVGEVWASASNAETPSDYQLSLSKSHNRQPMTEGDLPQQKSETSRMIEFR